MIQIGPLYGYRGWSITRTNAHGLCVTSPVVRSFTESSAGLLPWPYEAQQARHICLFKCSRRDQPAPTVPSFQFCWASDSDGYGATRTLERLANYFECISKLPALLGRVEMWGEVVEGPCGFRAEYMAPTHLVPQNALSSEFESAMLEFAEAWGAIVCTLEELP